MSDINKNEMDNSGFVLDEVSTSVNLQHQGFAQKGLKSIENVEMQVITPQNSAEGNSSVSDGEQSLLNMEDKDKVSEPSNPTFNFDAIALMSDQEIEEFRDDRGFNILMLAAEAGRLNIVQSIIDAGNDVNFEVEGETAVNLAYKGGHHEVVLALLRENSKFPEKIQRETASDELKEFFDLNSKMHKRVGEANENDLELLKDYLKDKVEANLSLKYFYDPVNNFSLLKFAILSKKFLIYEFLIFLNIFLAPHESMDEINESLTNRERRKLSNINFRISPNLVTEPMMILMRNCKLSPDSPKHRQGEFMNFIRQAFDDLFMIPLIAIVLKIVAASRNFKIVFDFKRDSVTFLDPKSEPFCEGLMYLSGKIYIGAKDLLNVETANNVTATIAHELTHYAMFLVYGNWAKPYKKKDQETEARFSAISDECERLQDAEEIVGLVYDSYDEDMWHAELIVRVPHMIAAYFQNIEVLNGLRETFRNLFDFYEQTCMPQMEAELPRIERKFSPLRKVEEKVKRHKILNWFLIVLIVLGSVLSVFAIYSFLPVSWSDLSSKDQNSIKNSKVEFYGVEVKFGELFANDSKVFDLLSSEQIKKTLKGETEDLSRALNETLHHQVFLTWSNMTKELKGNFLTREVDFQGQKVLIGNLTKSDKTLKLLSSEKVRKIFASENLKISSAVEEKSKIFIERFFTDGNLKVWSEESYELHYEIRRNYQKFYENGKVNTENENVTSFDQIVNEIKNSKVFLLSSAAGDGKSTTFRHFSLKLKEKFPRKWIQFVDLKKHFEAFDKVQQLNLKNFEVLTNFLGEKVLNLESFELELFKELFASGNVIFLWDGVDEISPKFKNFMLDLTENILRTQNFQFISTRPQHSKDFEEKLKVKAQKLIPFSELDRFEFLVKTIADLKFNENGDEIFDELKHFYNQSSESFRDLSLQRNASKYFKTIAKGQQIFDASEIAGSILKTDETADSFVSNPLLISMISEISCDESFKANEFGNFNLFQLYETFVIKKLGIVDEKGEIIKTERDEVLASSSINIWQVHQFFALNLLVKASKIGEKKILNFIKSKVKESLSSFTVEQISRFGILQVNSETDFDFAHRSFAEFFTAQFFLDNIFLKSKRSEIQSEDPKWKVKILFELESKSISWFISYANIHQKYNFKVDFTFLSQLIKNAYSNDSNEFLNVLKFIRDLPTIAQSAVGFSALYEEMKSKNDLESFKLMMIDYLVKEHMQEKNYPTIEQDYKNKFETLKLELSEKSKEGVEEFGDKIRNGEDYQEIIEWAKKIPVSLVAIHDLIKSAYSNNFGNFQNVLVFIRDLPKIGNSAFALSTLYYEMSLSEDLESFELLMLAQETKRVMDLPDFPTRGKIYKEKLENLKKVFSSSLRDFIWSSRENCTIKSELSSEILFASDLIFDNESAQVLTSTQENLSSSNFKWSIQAESFAKFFSIKNEEKKEFLMVVDENFEDDRRRVLLTKSEEEKSEKFHWQIIPKGEKFLIVNAKFNESLIASDEKVFTSKYNENSKEEGKWEIKCDP